MGYGLRHGYFLRQNHSKVEKFPCAPLTITFASLFVRMIDTKGTSGLGTTGVSVVRNWIGFW